MTNAFTTTLLRDDAVDATGIVVPPEVIEGLGTSKRPAVIVTIGGYSYRSTVAVMGGQFLIPFSQQHRANSGIEPGTEVTVSLELDTTPRTVEIPADLAVALEAGEGLRAAFDRLSYSTRKEHVRSIEDAKTPATRERRISRVVESL